jgi:hypothetical protein
MIKENFKCIHKHNPISGHSWAEHGETTSYSVVGGGWMPTEHKTLRQAEKEVTIRQQILKEREERNHGNT